MILLRSHVILPRILKDLAMILQDNTGNLDINPVKSGKDLVVSF